ncbi:MAG: hypothetical protein AB7G80_04360 [Dongiaceae bacterium]
MAVANYTGMNGNRSGKTRGRTTRKSRAAASSRSRSNGRKTSSSRSKSSAARRSGGRSSSYGGTMMQ